MIKNIIFDFGDVFINLDKPATVNQLSKLDSSFCVSGKMNEINEAYEKGLIATDAFVSFYKSKFPAINEASLINAWNAIILDLPEYRLSFLEQLANEKKYRLFLLSNTNELHIEHVINTCGSDTFNRFKDCFEKFYLSYEIRYRKPDPEIYKYVLSENKLNPEETLFIDDVKENTDAASALRIKTWNLKPGIDDVTMLKDQTCFG
ncbi:HAD family phosphatase [Zhouia spongiae]|uniref:HAD family phosphatase n=1 Tax=Zhouia spongiae TaxID=2202721 RepID=A0ABY3YKM3_9FLAO|nr:HAD family phosphatase [Zhouia spongiae]UNY98243.1 HAD family phosphatase [Zhouia spongiae]